MGPDAKGGTAETTGAMGMASRKHVPVTRDAKPGTPRYIMSPIWPNESSKVHASLSVSLNGTRWVPAFLFRSVQICSDLVDAL